MKRLVLFSMVVVILMSVMTYVLIDKKSTLEEIKKTSSALESNSELEDISLIEDKLNSINLELDNSTELAKNSEDNLMNLDNSISSGNSELENLNLTVSENENLIYELEEENKTLEAKIVELSAEKEAPATSTTTPAKDTTTTVKTPATTTTSNSSGWEKIAEENRARWLEAGYAADELVGYYTYMGFGDYMDLKYHYKNDTLMNLSQDYLIERSRKEKGLSPLKPEVLQYINEH